MDNILIKIYRNHSSVNEFVTKEYNKKFNKATYVCFIEFIKMKVPSIIYLQLKNVKL